MVKRLLIVIALLIALFSFGAASWVYVGLPIPWFLLRSSFDSAEWKGQKQISDDVRIRMIDDLLRRYNFQGMTREQVVEILGEPDQTSYFKDWDMVYWLGPERGFVRIDSEWLVFQLDGRGRVAEHRIIPD